MRLPETAHSVSHEHPLTSQNTIGVIGAGVGGGFFSLELIRLCKEKNISPPQLTLYDRVDYLKDEWSPCKGCAGGTNRDVIETLMQYDSAGRVKKHDGGIFLKYPMGEERALSYSEVDTIAIHMPESGKVYPSVKLPENKHVIPVFRSWGPKNSEIHHVGLNAVMLELLKDEIGGGELPYVKSRVSTIDVTGQKPVVVQSDGKRIEHDLLVLAQGIARGGIKIITREGEIKVKPPGISAYLKEIEVVDGFAARHMYGTRRNKAHVVIAPADSSIHYAFFIPQKVVVFEGKRQKEKTIVTMAAFGKEGKIIGNTDVSVFLDDSPVDFFPSGTAMSSCVESCGCSSFIPSAPVGIDILQQLATHNIIAFGDIAGTGKLLKNGIGTTANQAIQIASSLLEEGTSQDALFNSIRRYYTMYVPDNTKYGRPLLDWVDSSYNRKYLPPILNFFLLMEQFLPRFMQTALPNIAKSSIGISSYEDINSSLQKGPLGTIIALLSSLIGNPLPKVEKTNIVQKSESPKV